MKIETVKDCIRNELLTRRKMILRAEDDLKRYKEIHANIFTKQNLTQEKMWLNKAKNTFIQLRDTNDEDGLRKLWTLIKNHYDNLYVR